MIADLAATRGYDTEGVLGRRVLGGLVDVLLVGLLVAILHVALVILGVLTLGLGFALFALVPAVPFVYAMAFLASRHAATPGQQLMGLATLQLEDGRRPTLLEAFVATAVFWLSLGVPVLLLIPLVTARHRTLHDLASGLLVVRTRPLTTRAGNWNMPQGV